MRLSRFNCGKLLVGTLAATDYLYRIGAVFFLTNWRTPTEFDAHSVLIRPKCLGGEMRGPRIAQQEDANHTVTYYLGVAYF